MDGLGAYRSFGRGSLINGRMVITRSGPSKHTRGRSVIGALDIQTMRDVI